MTTTQPPFGRSVRHPLIALLGAALLAACGGGNLDAEEQAADTATFSVEAVSAHASRVPMNGGRRAPICTGAAPDCPPNLPPTH
jgi:hypothetical protein